MDLYLEVQKGMKTTAKGCEVYNTAERFRQQKELFLALLTYGDQPEVREAVAEEKSRAFFNAKGELAKEHSKATWPKGSAITEAMKEAQKRMIKGKKASEEAVKAAKALRKKTLTKLAAISTEMDSTTALEKVAEYDSAIQALLSESGKLKHLLKSPSLPKHPTFSFGGGRGKNKDKAVPVSVKIS